MGNTKSILLNSHSVVDDLFLEFEKFGKLSASGSVGTLILSTQVLFLINDLLNNYDNLVCISQANSSERLINLSSGLQISLSSGFNQRLQKAREIITNVTSLTIVNNSTTIQGCVNLHHFQNLTRLELRNIPIHLMERFKHVRCSLQKIVVYNCLSSCKSIFELCGGDQSFPNEWSQLVIANLQSNNLTQLDNSVRLLSRLTVLDLSRNSLKDTDGLQYLHCLESLNLSFNYLTALPDLHFHRKPALKVLIIAFNSLDNLQGIHEYYNLTTLDVRENFLSIPSDLDGIQYLSRLRQLRVLGNPFVVDNQQYRWLVIKKISNKVRCKEFHLDSTPLSWNERQYVRRRRPFEWPHSADSSFECVPSDVDTLDGPPSTPLLSSIDLDYNREDGTSRSSIEFRRPGSDADVSSFGSDNEVAAYLTGAVAGVTVDNQLRLTSQQKDYIHQAGDEVFPVRVEMLEDSNRVCGEAQLVLSPMLPKYLQMVTTADDKCSCKIIETLDLAQLEGLRRQNESEATQLQLFFRQSSMKKHLSRIYIFPTVDSQNAFFSLIKPFLPTYPSQTNSVICSGCQSKYHSTSPFDPLNLSTSIRNSCLCPICRCRNLLSTSDSPTDRHPITQPTADPPTTGVVGPSAGSRNSTPSSGGFAPRGAQSQSGSSSVTNFLKKLSQGAGSNKKESSIEERKTSASVAYDVPMSDESDEDVVQEEEDNVFENSDAHCTSHERGHTSSTSTEKSLDLLNERVDSPSQIANYLSNKASQENSCSQFSVNSEGTSSRKD